MDPSAEYVPEGHTVHDVDGFRSTSAVPRGHDIHAVLPATLIWPGGHWIQSVDGSESESALPAVQLGQEVDPGTECDPTWHRFAVPSHGVAGS